MDALAIFCEANGMATNPEYRKIIEKLKEKCEGKMKVYKFNNPAEFKEGAGIVVLGADFNSSATVELSD